MKIRNEYYGTELQLQNDLNQSNKFHATFSSLHKINSGDPHFEILLCIGYIYVDELSGVMNIPRHQNSSVHGIKL